MRPIEDGEERVKVVQDENQKFLAEMEEVVKDSRDRIEMLLRHLEVSEELVAGAEAAIAAIRDVRAAKESEEAGARVVAVSQARFRVERQLMPDGA